MNDYVTITVDNNEYAINPVIAKALLECCSDKITLVDDYEKLEEMIKKG